MTSAALQSVLDGRFAELLQFREKPAQPPLPSGIPDLDFPRGAVTEIYGPPSSGRTTLLLSALAQATAREEVCALIDVDAIRRRRPRAASRRHPGSDFATPSKTRIRCCWCWSKAPTPDPAPPCRWKRAARL